MQKTHALGHIRVVLDVGIRRAAILEDFPAENAECPGVRLLRADAVLHCLRRQPLDRQTLMLVHSDGCEAFQFSRQSEVRDLDLF